MLEILLTRNYHYLKSQGFAVAKHSHLPIQISLAESYDDIRTGSHGERGIVLNHDVPHSLETTGPLHTFLLNPVLSSSRRLASRGSVWTFSTTVSPDEVSVDVPSQVEQLFQDLLDQIDPAPRESLELDERIEEAVRYIDELEQKRIAAKELAELISLSESRFLHLFKEELEVTLRSYLLWLRAVEGAGMVGAGSSITEAAHQAGFTDSAHLARTFKRMFGVTLSSVFSKTDPPKLVYA